MFREECKNDENSFFIAMNSELLMQEEIENKLLVEQISEVNKNKFLYYFCYDVKDYVFQRKDKKGHLYYIVLPKLVCFKTYIPNYKLYMDLLKIIECRLE